MKYANHENLPEICRHCTYLDDMETAEGDFACWICKKGLHFPKVGNCNKRKGKELMK